MADRTSRAIASFLDVVAVEHYGPGMVRIVSWSDSYIIDVRERRCECPDMEYQLEGEGNCKHVWAALVATDEIDAPGHELVDDLTQRSRSFPSPDEVGGQTVTDPEVASR